MSFKIPSSVPQDLLLIQELISTTEQRPELISKTGIESSGSEDSSSSDSDTDTDSEDELKIEKCLQVRKESDTEDVETLKDVEPTPSEDSGSDSSDESDSEDEVPYFTRKTKIEVSDDSEDEVTGVSIPPSGVRSKNEIAEPAVVPEVQTVGEDERLEKVGEIMSVIESVVVVRGIPSDTKNASERALDSESLLVFEDRKVLGYVHETFGPTQQPFYQIKFPSPSAINVEIVTVGKQVFHLPDRSNFVFPSQLRMFKGSDASNIHDEEVGDDELEFSDDEAEQAYKRERKRGRSSSVASSRFVDQSVYDASPYDEYGPYNMDSEAGPSRPIPLPYDDPYQDAPRPASPTSSVISDAQSHYDDRPMDYGDHRGGRGRGRGRGRGGMRGRGRGGGSGFRGREDRRGGRRGGDPHPGSFQEHRGRERERSMSNPPAPPRSLSPTSLAIARATGQYSDGSAFQQSTTTPTPPSPREPQSAPWNTQGTFVQFAASTQGHQSKPHEAPSDSGFVQPHINPRFAPMFGINMNFMQQQVQQQYSPYQPSMYQNSYPGANGWNGAWPAQANQVPRSTAESYAGGSEHKMDTSGDSRS